MSRAFTVWIIWLVNLMYLIWAVMLALWPSSGATNSLYQLVDVFGRPLVCSALGASSLLSSAGLLGCRYSRHPFSSLTMSLPQLLILTYGTFGAAASTIKGRYSDGTVIPAPHIFSDQLVYILIAVFYAAAIVELASILQKRRAFDLTSLQGSRP